MMIHQGLFPCSPNLAVTTWSRRTSSLYCRWASRQHGSIGWATQILHNLRSQTSFPASKDSLATWLLKKQLWESQPDPETLILNAMKKQFKTFGVWVNEQAGFGSYWHNRKRIFIFCSVEPPSSSTITWRVTAGEDNGSLFWFAQWHTCFLCAVIQL